MFFVHPYLNGMVDGFLIFFLIVVILIVIILYQAKHVDTTNPKINMFNSIPTKLAIGHSIVKLLDETNTQ